MSITPINPANGEVLETYPRMDTEEIKEIVASANRSFQEWKNTDFSQRAKVLMQGSTDPQGSVHGTGGADGQGDGQTAHPGDR